MITIVNCGCGNFGSIVNMLKKLGISSEVTSDPADVERANKLILPGVGAFDHAMQKLAELGLIEVLDKKVQRDKTPILGICLGMQLLTRRSAEGVLPGLGWLDAETVRFDFGTNPDRLKTPHMGWNETRICKESPLMLNLAQARFYFVHSYHVVCRDAGDVLATAHHGYDFVAAVARGNIFGAQFHPEKSHRFGLQLLRNFAEV